MKNIFSLAGVPRGSEGQEFFQTLLRGNNGLRVQRIISQGHADPENLWQDQDQDEWVIVLEGNARLLFSDGDEISLATGDYLFLAKHRRHRVTYTSSPCVWLAVFADELFAAD